MKIIVEKIKDVRKKKGYSHEFMANELQMSQPAYSKIENNETKLSVDRLFQIATILETPVETLLDTTPSNTYNQNITDHSVGHQEVENLYENKDQSEKIERLYEERLKDKDAMIERLQKMIDKLMGT